MLNPKNSSGKRISNYSRLTCPRTVRGKWSAQPLVSRKSFSNPKIFRNSMSMKKGHESLACTIDLNLSEIEDENQQPTPVNLNFGKQGVSSLEEDSFTTIKQSNESQGENPAEISPISCDSIHYINSKNVYSGDSSANENPTQLDREMDNIQAALYNNDLLPLGKENDEVYKTILVYRNFKTFKFPKFSSENCKKRNYLNSSNAKINQNFMRPKFRKISSSKKFYESFISFKEGPKHFSFKVFKDEDIGMKGNYKNLVQYALNDDDVESDSSTINLAREAINKQLEESMKEWITEKENIKLNL